MTNRVLSAIKMNPVLELKFPDPSSKTPLQRNRLIPKMALLSGGLLTSVCLATAAPNPSPTWTAVGQFSFFARYVAVIGTVAGLILYHNNSKKYEWVVPDEFKEPISFPTMHETKNMEREKQTADALLQEQKRRELERKNLNDEMNTIPGYAFSDIQKEAEKENPDPQTLLNIIKEEIGKEAPISQIRVMMAYNALPAKTKEYQLIIEACSNSFKTEAERYVVHKYLCKSIEEGHIFTEKELKPSSLLRACCMQLYTFYLEQYPSVVPLVTLSEDEMNGKFYPIAKNRRILPKPLENHPWYRSLTHANTRKEFLSLLALCSLENNVEKTFARQTLKKLRLSNRDIEALQNAEERTTEKTIKALFGMGYIPEKYQKHINFFIFSLEKISQDIPFLQAFAMKLDERNCLKNNYLIDAAAPQVCAGIDHLFEKYLNSPNEKDLDRCKIILLKFTNLIAEELIKIQIDPYADVYVRYLAKIYNHYCKLKDYKFLFDMSSLLVKTNLDIVNQTFKHINKALELRTIDLISSLVKFLNFYLTANSYLDIKTKFSERLIATEKIIEFANYIHSEESNRLKQILTNPLAQNLLGEKMQPSSQSSVPPDESYNPFDQPLSINAKEEQTNPFAGCN